MNKNTIQKAIDHLSKIQELEILIKNNPIPQFEKKTPKVGPLLAPSISH